MSYLQTILADGNSDAARRARVALQPRDKYGRWVTTGAALLAGLKFGGGEKQIRGRAIGGSADQPGKIRMLVGKGYESVGIKPNTVLTVDPTNGELFTGATIDVNYLKKKGIDPSAKADLPSDLANQPQDLKAMDPQPADALDVSLATDGLTPAEDAPLRKERDAQPVAKLSPAVAKNAVEGADVKDIVTQAESAPTKDPVDSAISDLMGEVAYEGDTNKTLDSLISEAKAAKPADDGYPGSPTIPVNVTKAPEGTTMKFLDEIKRGDVLRNSKGEELGTVLDTPSLFTASNGRKGYAFHIVRPDGKIEAQRLPNDTGIYTDKKRRDPKSLPEAPGKTAPTKPVAAEPAKPVEAPTAPEVSTPETKAPEVAPVQEPAPAPTKPAAVAKPAKRANDDGKLIPRQFLTEEQMNEFRKTKLDGLVDDNGAAVIEYDDKGKPYQPKDPNALLNLLTKAYPKAKFNDQGHLVLMREVANENGKKIQWEIRAANSGDKKIVYMFNFKDLATGEEQTLIHKDARDSVQSILGKTNSPEILADILTGRQTRKYSPTFDTAVHANDPVERARYFAYQGRTKNIADLVKHYSTGYAERVNSSNGTLLEKEVKSVFDAFDSGDRESAHDRIKAVFGRIPMDEQSHAEARQALRDLYKERNPGKDQRSFSMAVSFASAAVRQNQFDDPNSRAIPYSSADKVTPIEEGMVVEYENNLGAKSVVRVTKKQKVNTATPTQSTDIFEFGDYVTITDANGKTSSLPTTSLKILKDQNTPLTTYKGRVQGRELREARGFGYRPSTLMFPGQTEVPDRIMKVDDMTPGDNFYGKDGANLGVIVEVVPVVGKNDKRGYGILYINRDGDLKKVAVASGESRGPQSVISNDKAAEKQIIKDVNESDPDFDLEAIQFETDPSTVEKPKTVGLDFNVPINAKRNAEQQIKLNDAVQKKLDEMTADLSTQLDGWTYQTSSFNAKSFFRSDEFEKLVEKARKEYPELSDSEIRTLLELQHSKMRGFFGMSEDQMLEQIMQEAATYNKDSGSIRTLQLDVVQNKETGKLELAVTPEEKAKYEQAINDIEKFSDNVKMGALFDPEMHSVRVVSGASKFAALYNSVSGGNKSPGYIAKNVLGVNITKILPEKNANGELKRRVAILINNGLLRDGAAPEGFVDPITDTVTHEFGHTVHNTISTESFERNSAYAKAFKEYITKYGSGSQSEHFAESFSKYIQTGKATPTFFQFLQAVGLA